MDWTARAQNVIEHWLKAASIRYTASEGQPTWNDLRWLARDVAALAAEAYQKGKQMGIAEGFKVQVVDVTGDAAMMAEVGRLKARVAELEAEDRLKTEADLACAHAAEAEIARLEARVAALTAALRALLNAADALAHYANLAVADHAIETARQALDAAAGAP
jgi:hypothetical protein